MGKKIPGLRAGRFASTVITATGLETGSRGAEDTFINNEMEKRDQMMVVRPQLSSYSYIWHS